MRGGTKYWYQNDMLHRTDGPAAITSDGTQEWWVKGKLHREDGPAVIPRTGPKEWWINGIKQKPPKSEQALQTQKRTRK